MKKVRIILGAYGYRADKNSPVITSVDKDYGPITVSDEEAERIIGLGVAEEVKEEKKIEEKESQEPSMKELQQIAKSMGLRANGSKEELMERIEEAKAAEDGEEPPVLEAAEVEK